MYFSDGVERKPDRFIAGPPSGTGRPWSGPLAVGSALNAKPLTWQLAQDCWPEADSAVSPKIFWPSCAAADICESPAGAAPAPASPPPPQACSSAAATIARHGARHRAAET